jgi:hypothetical protein
MHYVCSKILTFNIEFLSSLIKYFYEVYGKTGQVEFVKWLIDFISGALV